MAPGKIDLKPENVLMGLKLATDRKEDEIDKRDNIVCIIRDETSSDWRSVQIVINLDKRTTMMKLYKIVAEKANYVLESFSLSFLKPSADGKTQEEVILKDSSETTLDNVVGDVKAKTNNFLIKAKNGKGPVKRIQQPVVSFSIWNDSTGLLAKSTRVLLCNLHAKSALRYWVDGLKIGAVFRTTLQSINTKIFKNSLKN